MLLPNIIQATCCRALSTRLAVNCILTSSTGCRLQFSRPNGTLRQLQTRSTTVIHPEIIKYLTPPGSLLVNSFKYAPKQQSEPQIYPMNISDAKKIILQLPGLNKPHDFICPVPFSYYGYLPLEKNLPPIVHQEKLDPNPGVEIKEPSSIISNLEKLAAVLVQIRKKKMKKHKKRKLAKRMFHTWQKLKQRRLAKKEKHFVECQLARIKNAEDFNAEEWVNEYLRKATTDPATLTVKQPLPPRPTKYVFYK